MLQLVDPMKMCQVPNQGQHSLFNVKQLEGHLPVQSGTKELRALDPDVLDVWITLWKLPSIWQHRGGNRRSGGGGVEHLPTVEPSPTFRFSDPVVREVRRNWVNLAGFREGVVLLMGIGFGSGAEIGCSQGKG